MGCFSVSGPLCLDISNRAVSVGERPRCVRPAMERHSEGGEEALCSHQEDVSGTSARICHTCESEIWPQACVHFLPLSCFDNTCSSIKGRVQVLSGFKLFYRQRSLKVQCVGFSGSLWCGSRWQPTKYASPQPDWLQWPLKLWREWKGRLFGLYAIGHCRNM